MTNPSSARPPVPSADESTKTSLLAPLIAIVVLAMGGGTIGTAGWPFVCISFAGLILLGLASAIWGFYVAAFYGPRHHVPTAIIGFILNAAIVVGPIVLLNWSQKKDDEYEGRYEARAPQSATDRYRN